MNKKIIIFDMDGVLFDSVTIAEDGFLEDFPEMTRADHKELLTGNFHEEIKKFKQLHSVVSRTEEEKEARKNAYTEEKLHVGMYDGMFELVQSLFHEGCILIINTSAMERNCIPLLQKAEIQEMFDFVATGELARSKIEKFKIIENKYQANKNDMLFVTDTLGDVREADSAGVPTIGVLWGSHDKYFFNREPHENLKGIVSSPSELKDFILKYYAKK